MSGPVLGGAPTALAVAAAGGSAVSAAPLLRAFRRRGSGRRRDVSFSVQRAPQLAIAANIAIVYLALGYADLALGGIEPSVGGRLFRSLDGYSVILSLADRLPAATAATISWFGVMVARAAIHGRMLPDGLRYLDSWAKRCSTSLLSGRSS